MADRWSNVDTKVKLYLSLQITLVQLELAKAEKQQPIIGRGSKKQTRPLLFATRHAPCFLGRLNKEAGESAPDWRSLRHHLGAKSVNRLPVSSTRPLVAAQGNPVVAVRQSLKVQRLVALTQWHAVEIAVSHEPLVRTAWLKTQETWVEPQPSFSP